ncbi:response regulator [Steroidobacter sp.]|uniref:response regulator n=1 Tax=Steroidobacter sp. TaxID=1978227 RepID=UPI001A51C268|nr:response regulator [Steroidobacter sp.]MBL8267318.1 response regulator [Steroidobacter sp.]
MPPEAVRTGGIAPMTRPPVIRDPRVLLFPARRAPHREGGDGTGTQQTIKGPMSGMTVLVVEDDFIVAYDMQTMLEEQGARVLGPATSLREAQELLAKEQPTLAVLDVNLGGEYVFPLADALLAKDVPFVFATAYADNDKLFPQTTRSAPRLAKPVLPNVLIAQLMRLKR